LVFGEEGLVPRSKLGPLGVPATPRGPCAEGLATS
jgi:hypothetical protein